MGEFGTFANNKFVGPNERLTLMGKEEFKQEIEDKLQTVKEENDTRLISSIKEKHPVKGRVFETTRNEVMFTCKLNSDSFANETNFTSK